MGKVMIVVLPFQNLTGDPGQDFLSDGFTEEMITQLGRLDPAHLGVIARTSAMHYRDTNLGVDTIARELGVQYVVEGSVRGAGNQIRISAQLIAVRDQTHLWAETYERGTRDVLGVETEVAQANARAVRIKLSPQREAQLARRATSPDAYELFLKGRYYWNKRTEAGLKQGAEYFQEAIALDGDSAEAYAGLSDCYALLSFYGGRSVQQSFPLAKRAALQAIARDDSSAEAHTSLGFVLLWYDWDWPSAEREYRRALEINPGYATARQYYAEYLRLMGHQEEAILEGKRAIELDPLSPVIQMQLAMPYYYQGRNDEAIRQLQKLLQGEPDFAVGHAHLGWVYEQAGRYDDAIGEYETATAHEDFIWALGGLGRAYARKGDAAKAKELIILLDTKFGASASYGIALIYTGLGDKNRALQYLDRAYQDHYWGMLTLKVEPKWNDLRSDPRFVSLVHKIGLSRSF